MRRRMISAAFPVHKHALPQLVLDGVLAALAYFLAFWLRFGSELHHHAYRYQRLLDGSFWWVTLVVLASLTAFGQYQRLWKFVGQRDYEAVVKALVVATFVIVGLVALVHPVEYTPTRNGIPTGNTLALTLPISVIAPFFLLAVGLLVAARFAVQLITDGRVRSPTAGKNARQVLIVGGGDGGRLVVRELLRNPELGLRPVGFLDDDPVKLGTKNEHGLKVLGRTTNPDLTRVLDEVEPDEVLIAIPSASGELRGRVVMACRKRGIPVRTTPTVFELLRDGSGQLQVTSQLREVRVEDILGREPVREQLEQVSGYLRGQVVLVTGAGGSIGSELCRQIAAFRPAELLMLDRDESALHALQLTLYGEARLDLPAAILADIRDADRMHALFAERRPEVVFHAAALKHVNMLEQYPDEGWKTNVLGTRNVLAAASAVGVGHFINISTDKAADPVNVLGRTKRMAERLTSTYAATSCSHYLSVRFGNVLGSRGSVLETFAAQINRGGPVTVTDPEVTRYFMTIPEAVQLVIQAGAIGRDGEALVLDMGTPVRIADVAAQLIAMEGRHIDITYTGLRPGEKLHEDLFSTGERDQRPVHPMISHVPVPGLAGTELAELSYTEDVGLPRWSGNIAVDNMAVDVQRTS